MGRWRRRVNAQIAISENIVDDAATLLAYRIQASIRTTGRCRLGLSGGSTPGPILKRLAGLLPFGDTSGLVVTWVDERHPEASNQALARECWPEARATVPMVRGGSLADDLTAFTAEFEAAMASGLDVALLGVGPDGHIASLFPGHAALNAVEPAVAITASPKPPATRITLTLPVLNACPVVIVVARGGEKAEALRAAAQGKLPLGRLRPTGEYHWLLDSAAARLLGDG